MRKAIEERGGEKEGKGGGERDFGREMMGREIDTGDRGPGGGPGEQPQGRRGER